MSNTIENIIAMVNNKEIVNAAFQRPFSYNAKKVCEVCDSILKGIRLGSILTVIRNPDDKGALPYRELETNAQTTKGVTNGGLPRTAKYLLDGQQRVSSIYRGFVGHNKTQYYVDLDAIVEDNLDADWVRHYNNPDEVPNYFMPLKYFITDYSTEFDEMLNDYCSTKGNGDIRTMSKYYTPINDARTKIAQFDLLEESYPATTDFDMIAKAYIRVNNSGKTLTAFELSLCKYYVNDEKNLNVKYEEAKALHPIINEYKKLSGLRILQVLALVEQYRNGTPRKPDTLDIDSDFVYENWDDCIRACVATINWIKNVQGVDFKLWDNTPAFVVILASSYMVNNNLFTKYSVCAKKWFWRNALSDQSILAQRQRDFLNTQFMHIQNYINGVDAELVLPTVVLGIQQLVAVTPETNKQIYNRLLCYIRGNQVNEPFTGESMSEVKTVEYHHIFPSAMQKNFGLKNINSVCNILPIDKDRNRELSNISPEQYIIKQHTTNGLHLPEMERNYQASCLPFGDVGELKEIYNANNFEQFLNNRATLLVDKLSIVLS